MKEIKQHIWIELLLQSKPLKINIGEQAHVTAPNSKKIHNLAILRVNPKV
jgi:hypothetical protein